tara:strand:+ start:555 stop:1292 length:738 start_codon:yes stop_codon:yes gene_type:complete
MFACEKLEEQTAPLSGIFYIFEGWNAFMEQDYDRAKELFSGALLADEGSGTNYYDHAYAGLGWTAIYKANEFEDTTKTYEQISIIKKDLRDEGKNHFQSAHELVNLKINLNQLDSSLNQLDEIDLFLYQNILAGEISNLRYQALLKEVEFYTEGFNDEVWSDALDYSQQVIDESEDFISRFENYKFQYDEKRNVAQIRLLKVESYILLGNIESAVEEAILITNLDCGASILSIEICLDIFFNLPE